MVACGLNAHIDGMTHASFSRRAALALGGAAAAFSFTTKVRASTQAPVLVELFTSQGCSSCPLADALLEKLRRERNVVALSYHVDYWDYLGWKDTLGSAAFSQRQYDYAQWRGDSNVYTPQTIVNGGQHYVGSNGSAIQNAIGAAADSGGDRVPLTLASQDGAFLIEAGKGPAIDGTVWLVALAPEVTVKIKRGENAGSSITYTNIVRRMVKAGSWSGKAERLTVPAANVMTDDSKAVIALLQQGGAGPLLGLASLGELGS